MQQLHKLEKTISNICTTSVSQARHAWESATWRMIELHNISRSKSECLAFRSVANAGVRISYLHCLGRADAKEKQYDTQQPFHCAL